MLVIQHFRHCSEQKVASQGEVKEREQMLFFKKKKKSSEDGRDEFSGAKLENCQGLSIPERGGKLIPPARNGE